MSHFYAMIPTSARRTTATASGHVGTGIGTVAASWKGAITVDLWHDETTGEDHFIVRQTAWHGQGMSEILARGIVGKPATT